MNRSISFDETRTTQRSVGGHLLRRLVLWVLILLLGATVGTVLELDASMTPDQRIMLLQQSGVFP